MKRHKRNQQEAELDITSFMNLMIILVPVLLISMVFNHVTVLELLLPLEDELKQQELNPDDLSLEIVVRESELSINLGPLNIETLPKKQGEYDLEGLSNVLQVMKKKLGQERTDVVILSEPDIDYQILISIIDTAKSYSAVVAASVVNAVLFPDVSLGDAPKVSTAEVMP
ncbi:biopolymer transporter ExbD [Bermanella sp. R86510]|uniref:biopolymer transporter ExbD n=1 Tax=unclassified Bermanella TaxID=2627862 RepID=UPI0037CC0BCC